MAEFTTREMVEAIDQAPPVRRFLTRTFFGTERTHVAEKVEFDVRKSRRIMAPFVSPRIGGKVITRRGFNTVEFTTPRLAPEREMTLDDLSTRSFGENIYSRRTPDEREDELLAEDLKDLDDAIQRRLEWMTRSILFTGKLDVIDEEAGVEFQVDYGFENITVMTAGQRWRDGINPLPFLRNERRKIIKECGVAPDVLIMGTDVVDSFMENEYIMEAVNKLNLKNIVIEPKIVDDALTFYGRIAELGLDIYGYDEYFVNDDDNDEGMIPADACLMANSKGIGRVEYGLITQYEKDEKAHSYEAKQVPKIYVENDVKKIRLTSRPLPMPKDVSSWSVLYPNGKEG